MSTILSVNLPMLKTANNVEPIKLGDSFIVATNRSVDMVKVCRINYKRTKITNPTTIISVFFVNPQNKQYKICYWCDTKMLAYYVESAYSYSKNSFNNVNKTDIRFYANIDDYYSGKSVSFLTYNYYANMETDKFSGLNFGLFGQYLSGKGYIIRNNSIREEWHNIDDFDIIDGIIDISVEDMMNLKDRYGDKFSAEKTLKSMVKINGFDDEKKNPIKIGSVTLAIYDDDNLESLQERLENLLENFSKK